MLHAIIDQLEPRRLLSTITWVNRGQASDRFGEVFGAAANTARAVIDEAIDRWERTITDFNYSNGTNTYSLTIAMRASGTGTGGQGGATATIGTKPSAGTLVLDRGTDGAGAGWYLDPVPADDIEFNGLAQNAFSATALNGSPPFGLTDMLTVAMHEIGHCIGIDSNAAMNAFATDTGLIDTGTSTFWAFEGPSVSHLFTEHDSVNGPQNGTQHTADSSDDIFFDGQTWNGTSDLMNAIGNTSRRKMIDNVIALVIHDAWDYDVAVPENFGTFYSTLNRSTGQLLVRGQLNSADPSNDDIEIGLFLGLLVVSVDIGEDVPGTGPLPGPGNVDSFVSLYNPADVTSIIMNAGDGDDTITINSFTSSVSGVNIDAGDGNDTVTLGNGDLDTNLQAPIAIVGGAGTDAIVFNDTTDGPGSDSYSITSTSLDKPAGNPISWLTIENLTLNASPNNDVISVTGTLPGSALRINSRDGDDTINIQNTNNTSPVTFTTGNGADTANINTDDTNIALAIIPGTEHVTNINIGIGGRLALAGAGVANSFVLITQALSIDNGGVLDLTNNSMIVDHGGVNPYVQIRNWIASARAGGAWTGSGITSFGAFIANPKNTTLGMLTSTEYFGIYGFGADYLGQNIDLSAIVVKYTYYGDTDLNGVVNFDDYSRIDSGFNFSRTGWFNGDFDGNGVINFDDYSLIDLAFNTQGVPLIKS